MKKVYLFAFAFVVIAAISSCKKDHSLDCYVATKDLTGIYKITKITASGVDVPLTTCQQNAMVELYATNTAKTVVYEEPEGCSGDGNGTWDVDVNTKKITINTDGSLMPIQDADITSWDCNTLVVSQTYLGISYQMTMKRVSNVQ